MSYCRWSSDNFQCDIYAYESDAGYETHVATNRYIGPMAAFPYFPWQEDGGFVSWRAAYEIYRQSLDSAVLVPLELPLAGESFTDETLDEFEARLYQLREIGYMIPDSAFEIIADERKIAPSMD